MAVGAEPTDIWKTLCVMAWIFRLEITLLNRQMVKLTFIVDEGLPDLHAEGIVRIKRMWTRERE